MLKLSSPLQSRSLREQVERALQRGARTEWVLDIPSRGQGHLIGYFQSAHQAAQAFEALRSEVPDLPPAPEVHPLSDHAWQGSYRDHFGSTRAGRFLLVPSWAEEKARANTDAIVLSLDPGLTFGTDHPTTRLCLAALETFADSRSPVSGSESPTPFGRKLAECRFIDAGSGSGVLGIAALLVGFEAGFAFDTDPLAVARTRENAQRNGVLGRLSYRECGIELGLEEPADLVFANIHHNVLVEHREQLLSAVMPGGVLILSGCLEADRAELQAAFEAEAVKQKWPLERISCNEQAGWGVIEIARRNATGW